MCADTQELVHIDLGIAFDQGRFLKTPERVPFRLTRDLEDGLGVSGVAGRMGVPGAAGVGADAGRAGVRSWQSGRWRCWHCGVAAGWWWRQFDHREPKPRP